MFPLFKLERTPWLLRRRCQCITDDGLDFLQDVAQMIGATEAFRIDLAAILRPGRTCRKPSTFCLGESTES